MHLDKSYFLKRADEAQKAAEAARFPAGRAAQLKLAERYMREAEAHGSSRNNS